MHRSLCVLAAAWCVCAVDAASVAMKQILHAELDKRLALLSYGLKAITGGTDALAHAHISWSDPEGNRFHGEAIDADVILASVHAMVKGANRALNFQKRNQTEDATPVPLPANSKISARCERALRASVSSGSSQTAVLSAIPNCCPKRSGFRRCQGCASAFTRSP